MSGSTNAKFYGVQGLNQAQTSLSLSNHSSDRIHEISVTSSSQPNVRDKDVSSGSGTSIQPPEPTITDLTRTSIEVRAIPAITQEMRKREKWVLAAMSLALFLAGWNDGTLGPLLPRIQEWYGVSDIYLLRYYYNPLIWSVYRSISLLCR
jgi:hypothetical protein